MKASISCGRGMLKTHSCYALSSASIYARSVSEHITDLDSVASIARPCICAESSTAASHSCERTFLGSPNIWLSKSPWVYGDTLKRSERDLESTISPSAGTKRHGEISFPRQACFQVRSVFVQKPAQ